MILAIGSRSDHVFPRVLEELRRSRAHTAVIDEDQPAYEIRSDGERAVILGPGCSGDRKVRAVFVRHRTARSIVPSELVPLETLQRRLNVVLLRTPAPVLNRPSMATSNYSKPYQLQHLATLGFDTPETLVTNDPDEARAFVQQLGQPVIVKGVSNTMTYARILDERGMARLDHLRTGPVQLQEYIPGLDYRVHVVGCEVFVTALQSEDEDYRKQALSDQRHIRVRPASLPPAVLERCVNATRSAGLIVSGIDFKEGNDGRLVVLELNPYPQFTFYEQRSGQPITRAVVSCLVRSRSDDAGIVA